MKGMILMSLMTGEEYVESLRKLKLNVYYLGEKIDFEYSDNAESYIARRKKLLRENFQDLKIELGLKKLKRIECYDISNIQGKESYGSMVVAQNGEIMRSQYRVFKIKSMDTPNDMHMLKEVMSRRFSPKHKMKYDFDPEIVLVDGGKAQLSVVNPYIPKEICLLGITKGRKYKRKGGRLLDEFWYVNRDNGDTIKVDLQNKSLLIDLRDEAHRFAILHHRKARAKASKISELNEIMGIGEKSRVKLLKVFKNVENIKAASLNDINVVLRNRKRSKRIFDFFNGE